MRQQLENVIYFYFFITHLKLRSQNILIKFLVFEISLKFTVKKKKKFVLVLTCIGLQKYVSLIFFLSRWRGDIKKTAIFLEVSPTKP